MPEVAISVALRTVGVDYITFVSVVVVSDILVSRTDKCYPLSRQNITLKEIYRYSLYIVVGTFSKVGWPGTSWDPRYLQAYIHPKLKLGGFNPLFFGSGQNSHAKRKDKNTNF